MVHESMSETIRDKNVPSFLDSEYKLGTTSFGKVHIIYKKNGFIYPVSFLCLPILNVKLLQVPEY